MHDRPEVDDARRVVRLDAPAGGPMWLVVDPTLAREVLADPRVVKDPGRAPDGWDGASAGLEPPAAAQLSLTTADGPAHTALRRAHAPLFTPRSMRAYAPRAREIAAELLDAAARTVERGHPVDLMADLAGRLPARVVLDVLGAPPEHADAVVAATAGLVSGDPERVGAAMGAFFAAGATALDTGERTRADELGERMPSGTTRHDLLYALFGVLLAGQLTTEVAVGDVLAAALDAPAEDPGPLVERALRAHPPAARTLWRFTDAEIELDGHRLPARSPVLVDVARVCAAGADLAFGSGPHYCLGAALARTELVAVVEVLRHDFPGARLAPGARLHRVGPGLVGAVEGDRLAAWPVVLQD